MATYAIGDIHGCFLSLEALLARVRFRPARDRLWLVGDLVNRGPRSLEVLRWAAEHEASLVVVLGNHDLHLLARSAGVAPRRPKDTLEETLDAPDAAALLGWLRARPLLHREGPYALVHAGLLPAWSLAQAEALAREVEPGLRGAAMETLLRTVREAPHPPWSRHLPAAERRRLSLATFTLVRTLAADGSLFLRFAGPPAEAPAGCSPWFSLPHRREAGSLLIFGHWAALGLYQAPGLLGLDTGCAWGGELTAMRLDDGRLFQVENQDGSPAR